MYNRLYLPFPRSSLRHGWALKCISLARANKHGLFWKHLSVDGTAKVNETRPFPSENVKIELFLIQIWPIIYTCAKKMYARRMRQVVFQCVTMRETASSWGYTMILA